MAEQKKTKTKKQNGNKEKRLERVDIRISGAGGHGIISTGMILGEAVALRDGRNVSQSQAYGPAARGGAARTDVIISDGDIFFPECTMLDILIAFTYEAYERFAMDSKPNGIVIADEEAVDVLVGNARTIKVPFMKIARDKFKHAITANMIALGFLSAYTRVVSARALREIVGEQYNGTKFAELNLAALEEGFRLGKEYVKKDSETDKKNGTADKRR